MRFSSSLLPEGSLPPLPHTVIDPPERDSPPLSAVVPPPGPSPDEIAPRPGLLMCEHHPRSDWTPLRGKISIESATTGEYCTVLYINACSVPTTPHPVRNSTSHRVQRSVADVVCLEWVGLPGRLSRVKKKAPPSASSRRKGLPQLAAAFRSACRRPRPMGPRTAVCSASILRTASLKYRRLLPHSSILV